jgi:hypothetical protein
MLFFYYFTRLFWERWIGLLLSSALILMVFEFLSLPPLSNAWDIFAKLPFSLHKMFPFITFVTMLMFTWRLMAPHEWGSLSSIGRSPWQVIRTPLIWAGFLGLIDLFVIVPLGQQFFNPFEGKQTDIGLHSGGWKKGFTPNGYLFFRETAGQKHILEFTGSSLLVRHVIAPTMNLNNRSIVCFNAWDLQAHRTPAQKDKIMVALSKIVNLKQDNTHPLLLSLAQVHSAMQQDPQSSLLLLGRRHYWWSHFLWSLTLVPLAPALLLGQSSRHWSMLWAGGGMVGCLTLYLIKEWLYALSIPLAHSWPPVLLWVPALLTAVLAWGLLFEKKEI